MSTTDNPQTAFEAAWDYLWFALRHEESNWLGFVSAKSYLSIDQLILRAEDLIRPINREVERIVVTSVDDLSLAMSAVTTQRPSRIALVWLDVRTAETSAGQGVLGLLVARMNEHRAALLRNPIGVVVSTTQRLFPSIATPAPDLWSVRSFAIDIDSEMPGDAPASRTEADLANNALRSLEGAIGSFSIGTSAIGGADSFNSLAIEAFDLVDHDPVKAAERATAALEGGRFGLSTVLRLLDVIDKTASVDRATAVSLARVEILGYVFEQASTPGNGYQVIVAMSQHTDRLGDAQRFREAGISAERQLKFSLMLESKFGESPEYSRHVSLALARVGDFAKAEGDLAAAISAYTIGLRNERFLLARDGESRERLQDLLLALARLGDATRDQGDLAFAQKQYGEALELARKLVERFGESPECLSNLSVSLDRVGDVTLTLGDLVRASELFVESLEFRRSSIRSFGDSPERLRGLLVSLIKVGDVATKLGELALANESYNEGLERSRQLLEHFGESPERLSDVSVSLERLGDVAIQKEDLALANTQYSEGLAIRRLSVERFGETPERLRDLSSSLVRVGAGSTRRGDLVMAKDRFGEALAIRRSLVERFGETPERLRDVWVALNAFGDIAVLQGDLVSAEELFVECMERSNALVERFGETPERLRDVSVSLYRVGDVAERQGDLVLAKESVEEAVVMLDRVPESLRIPFDAEIRESLRDLATKVAGAQQLPGSSNAPSQTA